MELKAHSLGLLNWVCQLAVCLLKKDKIYNTISKNLMRSCLSEGNMWSNATSVHWSWPIWRVLSLEIERQCVWGWMYRFITPVLQNFQLPSDHRLRRDTQTPAYKKRPGCNSNLRHHETFLHPKINIPLLLTNLSPITYTEFHIKSTCVVTWHKMVNFQNSLDSSHPR